MAHSRRIQNALEIEEDSSEDSAPPLNRTALMLVRSQRRRVIVKGQNEDAARLPSQSLRAAQEVGAANATTVRWHGRYALPALQENVADDGVLLAVDVDLARSVVLRRLNSGRPHRAGDQVQQNRAGQDGVTLADAGHLSAISHLAIPVVFDAWIEGDELWMAIERLEGCSLAEYLQGFRGNLAREFLRLIIIILDACRTLAHHGLDHLPLRWSEILVDAQGQPRLFSRYHRQSSANAYAVNGVPSSSSFDTFLEQALRLCRRCQALRQRRWSRWWRRDEGATFIATRQLLEKWLALHTQRSDAWSDLQNQLEELARPPTNVAGALALALLLIGTTFGLVVGVHASLGDPCAELPVAWQNRWNSEVRESLMAAARGPQALAATQLVERLDDLEKETLARAKVFCEFQREQAKKADYQRTWVVQQSALDLFYMEIGQVIDLALRGNPAQALEQLLPLAVPQPDDKHDLAELKELAAHGAGQWSKASTIHQRIREYRHLMGHGEYERAHRLMTELEAEATDMLPLLARLNVVKVTMAAGQNRLDDALQAFQRATLISVASGTNVSAAHAATGMVFFLDGSANEVGRELWFDYWRNAKTSIARAQGFATDDMRIAEYRLAASAAMFGAIGRAHETFFELADAALHKPVGDETMRVTILFGSAYFFAQHGELALAKPMVEEALRTADRQRDTGWKPMELQALTNASGIDALAGRMHRGLTRARGVWTRAAAHGQVTTFSQQISDIAALAGDCAFVTEVDEKVQNEQREVWGERSAGIASVSPIRLERVRCDERPLDAGERALLLQDIAALGELTHRRGQWVFPQMVYAGEQALRDDPALAHDIRRRLDELEASRVYHPFLVAHERNILAALLHLQASEYRDAREVLTNDLDQLDLIYGDRSFLGLKTLDTLTLTHYLAGDLRAARTSAERAVERIVGQVGNDSPALLGPYLWLIRLSVATNQSDKAGLYLREAQRLSATHHQKALLLANLEWWQTKLAASLPPSSERRVNVVSARQQFEEWIARLGAHPLAGAWRRDLEL